MAAKKSRVRVFPYVPPDIGNVLGILAKTDLKTPLSVILNWRIVYPPTGSYEQRYWAITFGTVAEAERSLGIFRENGFPTAETSHDLTTIVIREADPNEVSERI